MKQYIEKHFTGLLITSIFLASMMLCTLFAFMAPRIEVAYQCMPNGDTLVIVGDNHEYVQTSFGYNRVN